MSKVEVPLKKLDHFELDILKNATIEGLLSVDLLMDDSYHLHYKPPKGAKTLDEMLNLSLVSEREFYLLLTALQKLMGCLSGHLLTPSRLSLLPQHIFYSTMSENFSFCYVPSIEPEKRNELLYLVRHLFFESAISQASIGQKSLVFLKEKEFDLNLLIENFNTQNPRSKKTWLSKLFNQTMPLKEDLKMCDKQTIKLRGNTCLIDKTDAKSVYVLHFEHNIVGRNDSCNVRLDDSQISKKHALITRSLAGCSIEDLASSNGTKVNGRRIQNIVPLQNGDTVAFGDKEFVFIH